MSYKQQYEAYRERIEAWLASAFPDTGEAHAGLLEAMRYSLLAGGKRLRPVLALEFCRLCGGDTKSALPVACAVELLHTYSLIHDDLPCMDNDLLRRGKPSNHAVFGEMTATLAGDALQAAAFRTVLASELGAPERAECALILAGAAGESGICAGQYLDMISEGTPLKEPEIRNIHDRKTAALIKAACLMGVVAGGGGVPEREAAGKYAEALGLAFQIRDDVLDATGEEELLGKPCGSDLRGEKTTFMTLYGEAGCEEIICALVKKAKSSIEIFCECGFLLELADTMAVRRY